MKGQSFWHCSNQQNEKHCVHLRDIHGLAGYGLFWGLVEKIHTSQNKSLNADYRELAKLFQCSITFVKSVVEYFDLFLIKDNKIYLRKGVLL